MESQMSDSITKIDPKRTALLVMDCQVATLRGLDQPEILLKRAAEVIALARRSGIAVVYVRMGFEDADYDAVPSHTMLAERLKHYGRALDADSPTTSIDETVAPAEGDIIVRKTRVGAFSSTDLDAQLRNRRIDTLILTGITTSGVVLSTTLDGFDHDYLVYVLADVTADNHPGVHDFLIEHIFPRHAHVINSTELEKLISKN
jgi:nicotinamidase-related amidase